MLSATSPASAALPAGTAPLMKSAVGGTRLHSSVNIGVATQLGHTRLMWIPSGPFSTAIVRFSMDRLKYITLRID
jgi:hypothetical protein